MELNELTKLIMLEHKGDEFIEMMYNHFAYSMKDINFYSELTEEEKMIIPEYLFNKYIHTPPKIFMMKSDYDKIKSNESLSSPLVNVLFRDEFSRISLVNKLRGEFEYKVMNCSISIPNMEFAGFVSIYAPDLKYFKSVINEFRLIVVHEN